MANIVKRAAAGAGLDPAEFSGHSLRAGFATTTAANGANERQIANQTGHTSMEVLRRYIRHGSLFTDNAATRLRPVTYQSARRMRSSIKIARM